MLLASSRDPANDAELNVMAEAAARGVHPDRIRLDDMLSLEEHVRVRSKDLNDPAWSGRKVGVV